MADAIPDNTQGASRAAEYLDSTCPSCRRKLKVPPRKVGMKIRCPKCQEAFRVKAPSGNATVGELPPSPIGLVRAFIRSAELQPGDTLAGRFEIIRKLGTGTFGSVYHAFDTQNYFDVALKIPGDEVLFNPSFMQRFRAEAQILAEMRHSNIVNFYDAQLDSMPRFLVTELIKGRDLEQELIHAREAGRWIDRTDAISIAEKLARALHHAHSKNVIHRDVKPANIMIDGDVVKLSDFGLARFGDPNMTTAGTKIGTPFYMSPEQVAGDPARVGPPSDLYALAVVLYELLCRRRPFEGPTAESVYLAVLTKRPRSPTAIDPTIPSELAQVCLRALARDPAKRWPSCAAFAEALRPWLSEHRGDAPLSWIKLPEPDPDLGESQDAVVVPADETASEPTGTAGEPNPRATDLITSLISDSVSSATGIDEPISSAELPLENPAGTSIGISPPTFQTPWRSWVRQLLGWFAPRVHCSNENVIRIEPRTQMPADGLDDSSQCITAKPERVKTTSQSPPVPLVSTPPRGSVSTQRPKGHPGASMGANRAPAPVNRAPTPAVASTQVRAAQDRSDPSWQTVVESIEEAHKAWREHRRADAAFLLDLLPDNLRGSEWAYLQALCRSPITSYCDRAGEISALAFNRTGRLLAAADKRGVALWDTSTHRLLRRLGDDRHHVGKVALSPNGRWLASSCDETIHLYDLELAGRVEPVRILKGHGAPVKGVAFAADGIHLVSAGLDESIRIWTVREGISRRVLRGEAGAVHALLFHPGEPELLVSSHSNGTIIVWDWAEACERCRGYGSAGAPIDALAIHPNGRLLATGAADGTLAFFDLVSLVRLSAFHGHARHVSSLAIDPSGRWLVSLSGNERSIRIGAADPSLPAAELGHEVMVLPFGATFLTTLDFSPAGGGLLALAGGRDETVKLWDGSAFWKSLASGKGGDRARAVAIDPQGDCGAVARLDGSIEIRELASIGQPRVIPSRGVAVHALAFHPHRLQLAAAGDDGALIVWDIAGGRLAAHVQAHPRAALAVAFDRDGQFLATAGADGTVCVWDAEHYTLLHKLPGHGEKFATCVAFASLRGEPRLYSGGVDRLIHVWDPRTGERVDSLKKHQHKVVALASSADGRKVVSIGEDRALVVWAADRRDPLLVLSDVDVLAGVAFQPSAGLLAAVGEDRSLIFESLRRTEVDLED